ncbi:MAG: hypothetical protein EP329_13100 [Deltaproteobacteria bacterium]|nr:MAG: hypothetical protein EP329_13100 [Deltaproteobacteria bacterium]
MKIRHLIAAALAFGFLGAPTCASSASAEKKPCEDYKPLATCSLDFEYVCQTTEDGCEQCTCVPRQRDRGAGPDGPYDP